jgi:hypothetical protein
MINGVAFDGANYWAVGGTTVYKGATPAVIGGGTTNIGGFELSAGAIQLNSVSTDGARVFITTKNSGIYYSLNQGTSWQHINPDIVNNTTVPYLAVAGSVDALTGGDKYLVGADGFGYYYLSISANSIARFNDSTILLYTASVRRILIDWANAPALSVFMGTAGGGVWRSTFNGGVPDTTTVGWVHE